jgi:hypothetical protein
VIKNKSDCAKIRVVINKLIVGPSFQRVQKEIADSQSTALGMIVCSLAHEDYKLFLRTHSLIRELNDLLPEGEKVQL